MTGLFLAAALFLAPPAVASSTTSPHPHQGVAPKFTVPARTTSFSDKEAEQLLAGQSVRKQVKYENGGRGISIMDVKGTPAQVWAVIDDFGSYPSWIDMLQETEVYGKNGNEVLVRFKLKVMGKDVEYFIDHERRVDQGYVTWQLDYSRESDIDDSTGYWLVYETPGRPGYTRVEYTVDLRLKGWIPGFVEDMLANKGLDKATGWVKKQVEGT
ncbi:MAG: SRPBCC family protein [Alphaproteobacteria bacterium]|nr:SRPBCC family protein [Alphaproteobacteria bacterium]